MEDIQTSGHPAQVFKLKGLGQEGQISSGFRRSASMSLLEMGAVGNNAVLPEEFEWEDEPMIVKSYGRQYDSRRE